VSEVERIKSVYSHRHRDGRVYSLFNAGELFMAQQLERDIIRLLRRHHCHDLGKKRILEVGCGTACPLRRFINYGAVPENLCGIDLRQHAIDVARNIHPNIDFKCGNAESLPFEGESLDIVLQFTVFTSILEQGMKHNVAGEMLRILKPGGLIIWYDYFVSKPTNRDVKGIGKREIVGLFPDCIFDFIKVTLAPPIARRVAPHSFLVCYLLDMIPLLRTHYLVGIRKK
jgi:SAM-dependent methyltransferase